jgi:Carboxypeptidase regulatory-like domain
MKSKRSFHTLLWNSILHVSVFTLVAALGAPSLFAQSTGGRIRGTVTDQSGATVAAAKVVITNQANGSQRDTQTGTNGEYIFLEVPVGTYEIEVNQTGFKKYLRKGIALDLNQIVSVDIALQVGTASEVIEVTGAPPLVDTTSTQLGAVVGERAVSELPLAQRDTYQLLELQPGVQGQLGVDNVYGSDRAGVVSVNGGRGRDNNFTVNGGDGNDQFANLPAIQPSPDAIAEFRVLTNTFDAEYGRNSGAVINVVTKSGSNELHGNLYEFFRQKDLNAQGFLDFEKLDYLQNQFGATLGGPIKKDKTFFFVTYEGDRLRKGVSSDQVTVPTDAQRTGDFSATPLQGGVTTDFFAQTLNSRCGVNVPLPSTLPGPPSQQIVPYATIFPDNVIPQQCMDQTALDLLKHYVPLGNVSDTIFQAGPLQHERSNQFTVKIDHELTKNQHLTGYYYFTQHYLAKPFAKFQAGGATMPGFGDLTDERIQQLNISHTWTIGSTAVNEARFTFFREGQGTFLHPQNTALVQDSCTTVPAGQCFTDPTDPTNALGIHPNLGANREGVPYVNISGGFAIGNNFEGELPQKGNTYQFSDSFGKVFGNHSIKFGGDFRENQFDQRLYFNINGSYYIYGGGPNDPQASDGNLFANYLLGLNDNYIQGSAQDELIRSKGVYLFAQDSWKIRSNLTLNYGLRWELNTPLADVGKKVQTYRPGQNTSIYPCQLSQASIDNFQNNWGVANPDCTNTGVIPTGLVVAGDTGVPTGLTSTYYKSFAPRIGVAWSPGAKDGLLGKLFGGPGKTSLRAGFGIFYNPIEQLVMEQFSAEPPFGGSSSIYNTMFNLPFQYQDGSSAPNPFNGILNPPRNQPVDWSLFRPILLYGQAAPHIRSQYAEQYNLTIQRELAKDLVLELAYVGRQGHRLLATQELNPGNPQTCLDLNQILGVGTCGQFGADTEYDIPAGAIPAGFTLHMPYGSASTITGPNPTDIKMVGIRPFSSPNCEPTTGAGCPVDGTPMFSNIFQQGTISSSAYNAFQASLEKRFSHGLQFTAAYTFGKSLDYASTFESLVNPFNPRIGRSPSLFDARHRFVFSYYWDLPVPKYEGFAGKVLNGWSLSGTTTVQSGFPIRITDQDDNELYSSFDFETSGQPNLIAPFKKIDPRQATCAAGTGTDPSTCTLIHAGFDPNSFSLGCIDPADTNNDQVLCSNDPGGVVLGTIGNAPRTICCGPGAFQTDIGIFKNTNIGERFRVQFRAELFNVFNHTQFFQPDGNTTDGTDFGRVKRARDPRLVQFALKLYF